MSDVFEDIRKERKRQRERWGGAEHDDQHTWKDWSYILAEQLFDAARRAEDHNPEGWRRQLVQMAAVAVAAIESYDRKLDEGG